MGDPLPRGGGGTFSYRLEAHALTEPRHFRKVISITDPISRDAL